MKTKQQLDAFSKSKNKQYIQSKLWNPFRHLPNGGGYEYNYKKDNRA